MVINPSLEPRRSLTAYAPLFIWIVVILGLGSGLGASNETSRFIRPLLEFFFTDALPETLTTYHGYIRKSAHVIEYAILGLLALRAFSGTHFSWLFKYRYAIAMLVVLIIASIDELNQTFTSSRTGSIYDVILDGISGLTALSVLALLNHPRNRQMGSS